MGDDPTVPQQMHDRPASQPIHSKVAGCGALLLALLLICGDGWWVVYFLGLDFDSSGFVVFLFLLSFISPLFLAVFAIKAGCQMIAPSAEQVLAHDKRPPVIYLRPFAEDTRFIVSIPVGPRNGGKEIISTKAVRASHEGAFKHALKRIGPVVTIGKPGDRLAPLGAARLYVADSEWQVKVEALVRSAAAIVICPETSAGTSWEVHEVAHLIDPRRILMVVPNPKLRPLGYARIQALTTQTLRVPLPTDCKAADAFIFDEAGRPQPLIFGEKLSSTLHPFIEQVERLSEPLGGTA
jgi:hypothetical protein